MSLLLTHELAAFLFLTLGLFETKPLGHKKLCHTGTILTILTLSFKTCTNSDEKDPPLMGGKEGDKK